MKVILVLACYFLIVKLSKSIKSNLKSKSKNGHKVIQKEFPNSIFNNQIIDDNSNEFEFSIENTPVNNLLDEKQYPKGSLADLKTENEMINLSNQIQKKEKELVKDITIKDMNRKTNRNVNSKETITPEDKVIYNHFKDWHSKHKRSYSLESEEAKSRFKIFKDNYKFIEAQNSNKETQGFVMGLGPFADMDFNEFRSKVLKKRPNGEIAKLIEETIKTDDSSK